MTLLARAYRTSAGASTIARNSVRSPALPSFDDILKAPPHVHPIQEQANANSFRRYPASGDYALVLPVAGKDRSSLAALGASQETVSTTLDRQRFDGEGSSVSEQFISDNGNVRRLLADWHRCWRGARRTAGKLGGATAARLQTSGEKTAVIDLTSLGYDATRRLASVSGPRCVHGATTVIGPGSRTSRSRRWAKS